MEDQEFGCSPNAALQKIQGYFLDHTVVLLFSPI
jgi:hypothetical protein